MKPQLYDTGKVGGGKGEHFPPKKSLMAYEQNQDHAKARETELERLLEETATKYEKAKKKIHKLQDSVAELEQEIKKLKVRSPGSRYKLYVVSNSRSSRKNRRRPAVWKNS